MSTYTIELLPSGRRFAAETGQPILLAAMAQGIGLPYSCRTGICRTCRGRVESGSVDIGDVGQDYLSNAERQGGWALLCRATATSDCSIAVQEMSRAIFARTLPARVIGMERVAPDVLVLRLKPPMNQPLLALPGQYVELLLKDGERRSYSIANAAGVEGLGEVELHVRHIPGGLFTDHAFTTMKDKEMLRFEGPLGSFYVREDSDRPIVLLASGTGFAPVKAMMEGLLASRAATARQVHIYWGGRRRDDLYMLDLAQGWSRDHANVHFTPVLSEPTPACNWSGRTGFVHQAVMHDHPDLSSFEVYACGAPMMVEAARHDFTERCALPEELFFADSFLTAADKARATAATP